MRRQGASGPRALLVLAAAVFAVSGSASGQAQPPWAQPFQMAVSQLRSGQTATAIQNFNLLWKANSNDAQLAAWIGASLDATSHHKEATPWYQRSLAIRPDFQPALNDLALNYATLGEFRKAEPLLREASRLNPSNTHAAYNLGLIALRLRNYAEAADAFDQARRSGNLAVSPDQVNLAEATARFHLREYGEAAMLLESVRSGRNSEYLLFLGSAQALSGDLPSAIKTLQQAVTSAPSDPQVYYRLALVFMLGRLDREARNVLAAGLKQIPNSPLLLLAEAVSEDTQGRLEHAIALTKQSLNANPRQAQTWAVLGRLYAEKGETENALKAYERALGLGADAESGVDRVQLLIRTQRFLEAEADLRDLAKRYPNNASVDRGFGKLYREERKFDSAEKYIRHAILLDPDNAEAHFALAEVLRLTQRTDEARRELAIFKSKKPDRDAKRMLELAANSTSEMELR
jgi:tetratricopeptide (TPR) repeat protein